MLSYFYKCFLFIVVIVNVKLVYTQNTDKSAIEVSLAGYNASNTKAQLFSTNKLLDPKTKYDISITNVDKNVQYFIIQVHSFANDIFLSSTKNFSRNLTVNGTNIGLVQKHENVGSYKFFIHNKNLGNVSARILVVAYSLGFVPIPGGCNLEFPTEIAPYQRLDVTEGVVRVNAQFAGLLAWDCENVSFDYEMYHLYLDELDFTEKSYFEGLEKMVTPENIEKYGKKIHKVVPNRELQRLYSSYSGTGAIFAVVVTFVNKKAAYVPISTYSCDISEGQTSCQVSRSTFSNFLLGAMIFLGLFLCLWGHIFFRVSLFSSAIFIGAFFSYMGLQTGQIMTESDALITSVAIGVIIGIFWLFLWCFFGIPIISILASVFALGFTIAAITFYSVLGDINIFESDLCYWGVIFSITLLVITLLIGLTHVANILACSVLGACAVVLSIDHHIGGNLKYIFVNVIRRATVDQFEYAVVSPPFQYRDGVLSAIWVLLTLIGLFSQCRLQKNRPPFPPKSVCCRNIRYFYEERRLAQMFRNTRVTNERTPLLGDNSQNTAPSAPPIMVY